MRGADAAGTHTHLLQECAGQPGYEWAVDIKGKDTFHYLNLLTQECGLLRNFRLGWNPADLLFYGGLFVKNDVKKFSDAGCNSDSTCGQKAENLGLSMQIDSATVAPQCLQDSNVALVVTLVAAPAIKKAGEYKCTLLLRDASSVNPLEFTVSCPMFTKNEFTEDDQSKSGSIRFDKCIRAADSSTAISMANRPTLDKIHAELANVGLLTCTMLGAPRVTGTFVQCGSNLLLEASADSPHVLVLVVKMLQMPYTKAKFDGAKQGLFKDAIASPSDTSPLNFENTFDVLSIAEASRRAGSIERETNISAMDAVSWHALSSTLGLGHSMFAKFNAELTTFGDPASTVVSVKSKKSDLSDGAVAGMVIGSVACAAILFGAALYLTKVKNKTSSEYLAGKAKVMMDGAQKKSEEREDGAGKVGRKSNDKNHRVRVSEEVAGEHVVCTDTPAKTGMIST